MKRSVLFLSLLFIISMSYAQNDDLHTPLEFQKAYKNGTRSHDGKPGAKYWHNTADYKIDVTVTPETREISGKETVIYINNSPDVLSNIVVRLYYDVFKKGNRRDMAVNEKDIGEGVEIGELKINGQPYDLNIPQQARRSGTNLSLTLAEPLKTGEELTIDVSWKQKVPLTVRRTGAIDSTSFFIAYWYPQIAVYDDIFGWDRINYTFGTEFYNNLGNFDVSITAPDSFLVWATGVLNNAEDILPDNILERYSKARKSKDVIGVVAQDDLDNLKMKSTTWHYTASEVSDFAFAMSDHYLWDATSQQVDGRDVLISSAYPAMEAKQFTEVTKIQQKAMQHFSEDVPGIPYPYPAFTTFIGLHGGGMEFPMMANNAGPGKGVTIHEMFHTYFPMYVRVNERRFAWMDEGWADFVTALVTHKYFKETADNTTLYSHFKMGLQGTTGTIGDLPAVTSSQYMAGNYGYHSYPLPAFTYALLYQHLGEEKFLECFREYIRRWAQKSPTPYDFFNTFENVAGEDLNWLWEPWYFGLGYPDLAIGSYSKGKLTVLKKGKRPVPVSVEIEYNDGSFKTVMESAKIWAGDNTSFTLTLPDHKNIKSFILNKDMVDVDEKDNFYPTLQERYSTFKVKEDIIGDYPADQYPITIQIIKKEGVMYMSIPGNSESLLLPKDATHFTTTDGMMEVNFTEEGGKITGMELLIAAYGVKVTTKKQ
ncbi:MAG: M1 family aminopeptidase [Cyclobacteriaceae bacterium]|nr:M1 family aminopeptidase [Cyclobacteriaceae bacterium]